MSKRARRQAASADFVYRTNYLHEAELVATEFERRNVAFYRAEEGPAGVRWAMPLSPAWEPGVNFLVVVPAPHAMRAASIVKTLPVSNEEFPGVWQSGMSEEDKGFWRGLAWIYLLAAVVMVLVYVIAAFLW